MDHIFSNASNIPLSKKQGIYFSQTPGGCFFIVSFSIHQMLAAAADLSLLSDHPR